MSTRSRSRDSRSNSRARSRSRSSSEGYEVQGDKRKEKKRAYLQRRKEREEQRQKENRAKRKNQAGGTQKERRDNKALKIKQGFTNNPQGSGALAGPSRVPLHEPAQLSKGYTADTVREKQTTFLQTYARMAAANTGAAKKETGTKLVELRVFKEDKSPVTRMDQWKIQFSMSNCILTATRQGVDPNTLWHRGTMLTTHHVVVYTNDQSSGFYKEEIGKINGLQAYLPEEWPRANSIYCTLPGAAECIVKEIGAHFAASTLGGIKENQVRIPRKPWQPAGPNTNFKVHLEVDDTAFQWLKDRNWTSNIGLYMVRWEHLPVRGVEGYIAPDKNIEELLKELENNIPTGTQVGADQAPNLQDLLRERQVTGESAHTANSDEEKEEAILLASVEENPEELRQFQAALTEDQEAELIKSCLLPPDGDLNRTMVPRRSSSPKQERSAKVSRSRKASGGYQSDVSDTVDTDKEQVD